MACAGDELERSVRQSIGECARERQIRAIALAAGDDRRHRDRRGVDDGARGLPHQTRELGRAEPRDLLERLRTMFHRKLCDELAVQEASRHYARGERKPSRAPAQIRGEPVERCADDQPAEIDPLSDTQRDEGSEGQSAHLVSRAHEPGDLVDRRLEPAPVHGNEIRNDDVTAGECVDLRLPRPGPGADPVQEDERQLTGSDSPIRLPESEIALASPIRRASPWPSAIAVMLIAPPPRSVLSRRAGGSRALEAARENDNRLSV